MLGHLHCPGKGSHQRGGARKSAGRVLFPVFPCLKRDGTLSLALLASFRTQGGKQVLQAPECKMLTVPWVKQAILVGNWFVRVDLKGEYFQIGGSSGLPLRAELSSSACSLLASH